VILLDDYRSLGACSKGRSVDKKRAISLHQNRVWNFLQTPSGRMSSDALQVVEIAPGSVTFTYRSASGRAEWLSRDPTGSMQSQFNAEILGADSSAFYEEGIFDPELLPEGLNLYGYVSNNPVNFVDPTGEFIPLIIGIGLAIIFSPDIANAPGPGDETYSSNGAVDMCISLLLRQGRAGGLKGAKAVGEKTLDNMTLPPVPKSKPGPGLPKGGRIPSERTPTVLKPYFP